MNTPVISTDPTRLETENWLRGELRAHASDSLPTVMVPTRFVVLPALPTLPNGKVDRRALPALAANGAERDDRGVGEFVEPANDTERLLAEIWQDLLGVAAVSRHADFFELGGDSLSMARMVATARRRLEATVDLRAVLAAPQLDRVAALLTGAEPATAPRQASDPAASTRGGRSDNPRSVTAERVRAAAVLPDDIRPGRSASRPATATGPQRVFVTGGTGYTGAHLIRELLDRGAEPVVLVRAGDEAEALARVRRSMASYDLWRDEDVDSVRAVTGDLALPAFGLDPRRYTELAHGVDLVVHNGAWSSYALPFRRLLPVNVFGTVEALRFAVAGPLKPLHYVSSLAVYPGASGAPVWREDELPGPGGVVGGYRQTKWVGDRLMQLAVERDIPCTVYRPGQIAGAQRTGACAHDTFLNAATKGCIQLGAALEFDVSLEITPVDYAAAAIAELALAGAHAGRSFNLPGARPLPWNEWIEHVRAYGYRLDAVGYEPWLADLRAHCAEPAGNELERFLTLFDDAAPSLDLGYGGSAPRFDDTETRRALAGTGIAPADPDATLVGRYLDWFRASGFLPEPGTTRTGGNL